MNIARERTPVVPASIAITTLNDLFAVQLSLTRWVNIARELIGVYAAGRKRRGNNQDDAESEFDARFHEIVSALDCAPKAG